MHRGALGELTTFVTVADHLSFREAALRMGVTASALSHSMRQLEERLGVRLLHRTTRSVSLTDAAYASCSASARPWTRSPTRWRT